MSLDRLKSLSELEVLALTIYGESRGEPVEGQIAVGCVIRNRISSNTTYSEICLRPNQFSCWNETDPNYSMLSDMSDKLLNGQTIPDRDYQQCLWVANGIINWTIKDNTKDAKNYLTETLFDSSNRPKWAKTIRDGSTRIGNQIFFNV